MERNVGGMDRAVRIGVGAALLLAVVLVQDPLRWLGLIGIVPLYTGLTQWCPLYSLLRMNTCPKETHHV